MAAFGPARVLVCGLGFGGAPAGLTKYFAPHDAHDLTDRTAVVAALRRAVEVGVSYSDTASGYGHGLGLTGPLISYWFALPFHPGPGAIGPMIAVGFFLASGASLFSGWLWPDFASRRGCWRSHF